jgi:hypothetical protein
MNYRTIYLVVSVLCFLTAIFFFRKEHVLLNKGLIFFITGISPQNMKKVFRIEGIWLIVMGYVSFIIYMLMMVSGHGSTYHRLIG